MKRTLSAHAARLCRLPERQPAARGVFETIAVQGHRRAHSNTQSPPGKLGGFCKLTKYLRLRPRSLRPATFPDNNLLTFIRYLMSRQAKRRRLPLGDACRLCEPKCKAASGRLVAFGMRKGPGGGARRARQRLQMAVTARRGAQREATALKMMMASHRWRVCVKNHKSGRASGTSAEKAILL